MDKIFRVIATQGILYAVWGAEAAIQIAVEIAGFDFIKNLPMIMSRG
ncbi:hypothetical protein GUH82_00015 [Xanthomonas citri pv. citri]|nr:hypothetical protein [Xanthomonas citri pv. citri]